MWLSVYILILHIQLRKKFHLTRKSPADRSNQHAIIRIIYYYHYYRYVLTYCISQYLISRRFTDSVFFVCLSLQQLMELVPVSCTIRPSRAETPPPSLKRTKLEDPPPPPVPMVQATAAYYSTLGMPPALPNYMVDPFHYFYGPWVSPTAAMYHLNNSHHLYRSDRYVNAFDIFVYFRYC